MTAPAPSSGACGGTSPGTRGPCPPTTATEHAAPTNAPDPAAYAKKPLKEFPQWPSAENNTYAVLSHSMYPGPSNGLAVEKIAKTPHPGTF
ncbi:MULTISPECIES: hypothetical protein [unclassified Streptomyces]|uniref:hypothetical protein n=1 Tax=unclassified Streptomyces TaxID=2593676 RepID=UPI00336AD3A8